MNVHPLRKYVFTNFEKLYCMIDISISLGRIPIIWYKMMISTK